MDLRGNVTLTDVGSIKKLYCFELSKFNSVGIVASRPCLHGGSSYGSKLFCLISTDIQSDVSSIEDQ